MTENSNSLATLSTDSSTAQLPWTGRVCPLSRASPGCFVLTVLGASGTGEHGVGIGKKEYLVEELGEGTVELMRTVKQAIDPLNLFNPGKVCHSV